MSIPKYVSSFLIGAALGAGVGLMLAPMPGRKMQKKVGDLKVALHRIAS